MPLLQTRTNLFGKPIMRLERSIDAFAVKWTYLICQSYLIDRDNIQRAVGEILNYLQD